jgi:hypothetical protein
LNRKKIIVSKFYLIEKRDKLDMQLKETENLKQALSKAKDPMPISSYKLDSLNTKPALNIR